MDKYSVAAQVAVAGFDGYYGKMSADQQRTVFGKNIFGRKTVQIDASGQGTVTATWAVAGLDTCFAEVTFSAIAADVNGECTIQLG